MNTVEDRKIREMLTTLLIVEELLTSLISLKDTLGSSPYMASLADEVQLKIQEVGAARWLRLDTDSPKQQRDAVRTVAGLLERSLSRTVNLSLLGKIR